MVALAYRPRDTTDMPPRAKPISMRIVEDIRAQIRSGQLKPGDAIPSINTLREMYDASETPVKAAIRDLQTLELIEGHQGKGNFVTPGAPAKA